MTIVRLTKKARLAREKARRRVRKRQRKRRLCTK
jgi:hypothetical protein